MESVRRIEKKDLKGLAGFEDCEVVLIHRDSPRGDSYEVTYGKLSRVYSENVEIKDPFSIGLRTEILLDDKKAAGLMAFLKTFDGRLFKDVSVNYRIGKKPVDIYVRASFEDSPNST